MSPWRVRALGHQIDHHSPQSFSLSTAVGTALGGGLPTAELDRSRLLSVRLKAITADVAQQSGATLVQASEITKGHDICSADPWVFGWTMPATPLSFGPMGFHPTEKAMSRIADAVDRVLN